MSSFDVAKYELALFNFDNGQEQELFTLSINLIPQKAF